MNITKPMLAGTCHDLTKLRYPVLATPKLDGIRCLIIRDETGRNRALSRNWKPIPNEYVRTWLEENCPAGFDGELVLRKGTFQDVSSAIMSRKGEPDFEYRVFDVAQIDMTYEKRVWSLGRHPSCERVDYVLPLEMSCITNLEAYEQDCLAAGYEGVMVRDPYGPYKCGRSTEREGWLLKIKRFEDHEAIIIGVEEKLHNANEQMDDPLGRTRRHSFKSGMVPMDTLGALLVKDVKTGVEFKIGTGFDDATRKELWERWKGHKLLVLGVIVKYKSQPSGVKEKPRFPVFLGLRSPLS